METYVYLGSADPEIMHSMVHYRELLAFHALLLEHPVILNDFLLWGKLASQRALDALLCKLISKRILCVALRGGVDSLGVLNEQLIKKIGQQAYVPFPGDDVGTFTKEDFTNYVRRLDRALNKGGDPVRWSPAKLGHFFRAKMLDSACSGEWAEPMKLLDAYDRVDELAKKEKRETHTCSDYWQAADAFFKGEENLTIKRWARSYYLTNLPDVCGLASCVPASLVLPHRRAGSGERLPWQRAEPDDLVLRDGLYNPLFLRSVTADVIAELRGESSFKNMQLALAEDDLQSATAEFANYARSVYARAPEVVPEHAGRTRRGRRVTSVGKVVASTAPIVAGVAAVAFGVATHVTSNPDLTWLAPLVGGAVNVATKRLGDGVGKRGEELHQKSLDSGH